MREVKTDETARVRLAGEPLRAAFEEHYSGVVRFCALLSGRRELAEDLAQEAFVKLAPKIDRLDPEVVGPYVRRIAVNLWKNRLRRLALERRHRDEAARPPAELPPVEQRDELMAALRRLPVRQRACIVLRYYEDLSEKDTAATLGCSVGTVKSSTSRGLDRLRKELSDAD
jgi:RNA polymerase sigma-70 factor (sigma-E family)